MIPVTKPFLPPMDEYVTYLKSIWDSEHLTNNGPLVRELEQKLRNYIHNENLHFVANGTLAIQLVIKAMGLKGEIITTPFSYVATTSAIVWENCCPVFVDIDKSSFNINPNLIENSINENTCAILATHVYGNPCDVEKIDEVAKKYGLKVIYDAAHCFGTKYKENSIVNYGDASILSFHATKLFHTVEGGAIVTNDKALHDKIGLLRNFGHSGIDKFSGIGINGKNSEFHAAMGVVNFNYLDKILAKRKSDHDLYDKLLNKLNLVKPHIKNGVDYNHSYYPVLFSSEKVNLKVINALSQNDITGRRYFFPLLSSLDYVDDFNMPVASDISCRVLCLPLYYEITESDIEKVCGVILKTLTNR